jgi:hypothetical protein
MLPRIIISKRFHLQTTTNDDINKLQERITRLETKVASLKEARTFWMMLSMCFLSLFTGANIRSAKYKREAEQSKWQYRNAK